MTAFWSQSIELLCTGLGMLILLMLLLWAIHRFTGNAGIVDFGWAGGLALLAILFAWQGSGSPERRFAIAAMGSIWGLRLAIYLLVTRVIGHPEEGRYVQLRKEWGEKANVKLFWFFQFQALIAIAMSWPFLAPSLNVASEFTMLEYFGMSLWLVAFCGEFLADVQLTVFKRDPANKGRTCRAGLWNYSRHPNYFFEFLVWCGFAAFALSSAWGWIGLFSPALILFFLFKVTGIPATEAQALRTKGDDYRDYQKTTSAFIPWFNKRSIHA